jgi:four helix bundle protein
MNSEEFKKRTKAYALRVMRLVNSLPKERSTDVMGRQLLRCATSVGANYRAACRARSSADFIAKLCIVEEEADEAIYWMELLIESGIVPKGKIADLVNEGNEILAMIVSSIRTAKANLHKANGKGKILKEESEEYAMNWLITEE